MSERSVHNGSTVLLFFCILFVPIGANQGHVDSPAISPEAATELICPTSEPSDCYPAIFQPTIHFQPLRPGQSLPPGLHIRMNIATGEKEARLNVPEEGEKKVPSKGLMIIDDVRPSHESSDAAESPQQRQENTIQMRIKSLKEWFKFGKSEKSRTSPKIQKPLRAEKANNGQGSTESALYGSAITVLKDSNGPLHSGTDSLFSAVDALTDLAHSLEWGVSIMRDEEVCKILLDYDSILDKESPHAPDLKSAIFLLLGTAIQNNEVANKELQNYQDTHDIHIVGQTVTSLREQLGSRRQTYATDTQLATLTSRTLFFLTQFCADEDILRHFITDFSNSPPTSPLATPPSPAANQETSLTLLLSLFDANAGDHIPTTHTKQTEEELPHTKVQTRIANFMTDFTPQIARIITDDKHVGKQSAKEALTPWCQPLTHAMNLRARGGRGGGGAEDAVYQSFLAARNAIKNTMEEMGENMNGLCG